MLLTAGLIVLSALCIISISHFRATKWSGICYDCELSNTKLPNLRNKSFELEVENVIKTYVLSLHYASGSHHANIVSFSFFPPRMQMIHEEYALVNAC